MKPQWISVKDQLPKEGNYLCYYLRRMAVLYFTGTIFKNESNGQVITSISHWNTMPLPNPPIK